MKFAQSPIWMAWRNWIKTRNISQNKTERIGRMQLQLMLTAEIIRQSLGNKDTQALVVEKLGQLVSRKNKIRFAAVYFKNGDPFAQDPYDPKWSLLAKEEQKPFYADMGLLAAPIMQNFPAMQIGAGGRRNKAAARVGGAQFVLIQTENDEEHGSQVRYMALAALDPTFQFFLVAYTWDDDETFSYNKVYGEFAEYYNDLINILKPR